MRRERAARHPATRAAAASRAATALRWLVPLAAAIAALLYANFLFASALDGRFDVGTVISMMEEPGRPHAVLLRVTDVVCAALVLAILPSLKRSLPPGAWSRAAIGAMSAFALAAAAAAAIPAQCQAGWTCTGAGIDPRTQVHDWLSIASDTFLYLAMAAIWCAVRRSGPMWLRRAAGWGLILGGLVSSAVFGYFNATREPAWAAGVSQRVHVLIIAAWIVALGIAGGRAYRDVGSATAEHDGVVGGSTGQDAPGDHLAQADPAGDRGRGNGT